MNRFLPNLSWENQPKPFSILCIRGVLGQISWNQTVYHMKAPTVRQIPPVSPFQRRPPFRLGNRGDKNLIQNRFRYVHISNSNSAHRAFGKGGFQPPSLLTR